MPHRLNSTSSITGLLNDQTYEGLLRIHLHSFDLRFRLGGDIDATTNDISDETSYNVHFAPGVIWHHRLGKNLQTYLGTDVQFYSTGETEITRTDLGNIEETSSEGGFGAVPILGLELNMLGERLFLAIENRSNITFYRTEESIIAPSRPEESDIHDGFPPKSV